MTHYINDKSRSRLKDILCVGRSHLVVWTVLVIAFLSAACRIQRNTTIRNSYDAPYPGKVPRQFMQLPVGAVRPEGYLADTLVKSSNGITGHLHEYRSDVFWNTWDNRRARGCASWWPFEQQAYWADGAIQLAYILDDQRLKRVVHEFIENTLVGQGADGYMGICPENPYSSDGDIYVQSLLSLSLLSYYSATGDTKIIPAMQRAYRHVLKNCRPIRDAAGNLPLAWRGGSYGWPSAFHFIYPVLWLYSQTGDRQMLQLADLIYKAGQEIASTDHNWNSRSSEVRVQDLLQEGDTFYDMHGVDATEVLKIPAIYSLYSGNPDDLNASIKGINKISRYYVQAHGGLAADEQLRKPGASVNTETCTNSTWSATLQALLSVTGDSSYADSIEKIVFNAGPGAMRWDGRGVQYYSAPNQVACTGISCRAPTMAFGRHLFRPDADPRVLCCIGQSNRLFPNFVRDAMWLASRDFGLVAACYGPSSVKARVGRDQKQVTIAEKTDYPFKEKIRFEIQLSGQVYFPLYVRIPGWCRDAMILINGQKHESSLRPGRMVKIERSWSSGDVVEISLPMHISFSAWNNGSVAVERGPLLYSLKIEQDWKKTGERFPGFPDWECWPRTQWNYALSLVLEKTKTTGDFPLISRKLDPDSYFTVSYPSVPSGASPWQYPPIQLTCSAKRVDEWKLENEWTPDVPQSPVTTNNPEEKITLVPFGSAPIRITYFPITASRYSHALGND